MIDLLFAYGKQVTIFLTSDDPSSRPRPGRPIADTNDSAHAYNAMRQSDNTLK